MNSTRWLSIPLLCLPTLAHAGEPVGKASTSVDDWVPRVSIDPSTLAAPGSMHEAELRLHDGESIPARVLPATPPQARNQSLTRAVYGYYPYWVADLSTIRWSALTHLAWFSIDLDENGGVIAKHGWPDPEVVTTAHQAGVRVDLTFTLFGGSKIANLLGSAQRRTDTATLMVDELEAGDADGISVDFEFVPGGSRDVFVDFITELRQLLDTRGHDDAEISIAAPIVDWSGGMAIQELMDVADWYFLMGYGYFWSGSDHAGPVGMLQVSDAWSPYTSLSMLRSIADISKQIDADTRRQLIWGVPYYGRDWSTTSGQIGASTIESFGAVTYTAAKADLEGSVEWFYEEDVENPWYRFQQGGTWHQVWYDDAESLEAKYELALAQDLGGVGMWALNYDKPHQELWDVLEDSMTHLPGAEPGHRDAPIAIEELPFHDERDTTEGPSHYFNYYDCSPDTPEFGAEWVYSIDVCQPGTVVASVPSYPDRDPDLHLLSDADQEACIGRGHTDLEVAVEPGRYLLVVDTFVDMPVPRGGAYELDVDFEPEPGSEGCAAHLACDAGACVCPGEGTIECGGSCVDPSEDPAHCGGCGNACATGESCVAGACTMGPGVGGGGPDVPPTMPPFAAPDLAEDGCGCEVAGAPTRGGWLGWLAVAGAVAIGRRRQRRG